MQKLELDQVYIVEAHFHDVFVSLSPFVCPFPNQTGKTTIMWTMQTNNNIWYHKKTTIYDIIRRQDNSCQDKSRHLDQSNYNQTSLKYQRTHAVPNLDVSMHLIRIQHFEYRIHKYLQCSIIYFLAFVCVWNIQHQKQSNYDFSLNAKTFGSVYFCWLPGQFCRETASFSNVGTSLTQVYECLKLSQARVSQLAACPH